MDMLGVIGSIGRALKGLNVEQKVEVLDFVKKSVITGEIKESAEPAPAAAAAPPA